MNNEKRWFILRFEIENGIHLFSKYFHGGLFSVLTYFHFCRDARLVRPNVLS